LKQKGLEAKPCEFYHDKLTVLYDVELFLQKLENEEKIENNKCFYERIDREEKEWLNKDLVIDPREDWKVSIYFGYNTEMVQQKFKF
jgi:hypothetical protein